MAIRTSAIVSNLQISMKEKNMRMPYKGCTIGDK